MQLRLKFKFFIAVKTSLCQLLQFQNFLETIPIRQSTSVDFICQVRKKLQKVVAEIYQKRCNSRCKQPWKIMEN